VKLRVLPKEVGVVLRPSEPESFCTSLVKLLVLILPTDVGVLLPSALLFLSALGFLLKLLVLAKDVRVLLPSGTLQSLLRSL
jgi:hypothetical protein